MCTMKMSALILSCILSASLQASESLASPRLISQSEGDQNEIAALRFVWLALDSTGKAVRVYYGAACQSNSEYPIPFPRIITHRASENTEALSAIREMFRNDATISVTEREHGIVRIRIGKGADDILHTKISILMLKPEQQYDVVEAIRAIISTQEFEAAVHRF